jgi:hypothetical protein
MTLEKQSTKLIKSVNMKILNSFLIFFLLGTFCVAKAQESQRYLDPVFDEVDVIPNAVYGQNYTVLTLGVTGHTNLQPLFMDVYLPRGDTATNRPLVIYLHTGNFLPTVLNQGVTGTYRDSSTVEICKRLAKLGYVVASATYRLGWNPQAPTQPERALQLINAAYRGLQDARTCVRFFRRDFVENGNSFGIDTSKIVMWGQGTGGYISLVAATIDRYAEIFTTSSPPGKFLTDLDGNGIPDPMIIEAFNGNIFGTSNGVWPGGGTIPAGDTLCLANHVGYSSKIHLCVNLGGSLGDIAWLESNSAPVICYHVPNDPNAPYNDDILVVPASEDRIIQVQGSYPVVVKANELGLNDPFQNVEPDIWTQAAEANSAKVSLARHDYFEGLYPLVRRLNIYGQPEGSPWDWWDPAAWQLPHPRAGMVGIPPGATYHFVGLLTNADMSPEKGRAYVDTIIGYYAPRAFLALGLQTMNSVNTLNKQDVGLVISPNPTTGIIRFRSDISEPIESVRILDLQGKMVLRQQKIQSSYYQMDLSGTAPGIYITELEFDRGTVIDKIVLH